MADFRRAKIAQDLKVLILTYTEFTVAELLHTIMRAKNIRGAVKESYFMSDEDITVALDKTLTELKEEDE